MTDHFSSPLPARHELRAFVANVAFGLYRGFGYLATPAVRRLLDRRAARGKEDPARLGERFGHYTEPRPPGPLLWVHAASVGESLSAVPLIEAACSRWPGLRVVITTGTVTSATLLARRLPPAARHQYVPVDLPRAVDRFLDHWRPSAALWVESEFWPTLMRATARRGIPMGLVNGRLSKASFRRWQTVQPLVTALLDCFFLVLAQAPADRDRFTALGVAHARYLGNLKYAAEPLQADMAELARLRNAIGARRVWVVASTHPGEETAVLAAHQQLAQRWPDILTIIVPRHPERGAAIMQEIATGAVIVQQRSVDATPNPATGIYLADTLGELGLWYRLAEVCCMGGSLADYGGHNPVEPARLSVPIVCGPHMANFAFVLAEMRAANAVASVADARDLSTVIGALLADNSERQRMSAAAAAFAAQQVAVLECTLEALAPLLKSVAS